MFTGSPPATGSVVALSPFVPPAKSKMKLVMRRSGGLMEMSGLHEPDSSQRSQLQPSPKSWYMIAPRASLDMALTLAGNGVRWRPCIQGAARTLWTTRRSQSTTVTPRPLTVHVA
eukprot:5516098-Prymnesium_polylepis.1